jgi:tRNA A-37 threonylcarbamoyl transferase component Bud32/tetratricopeptide (TPR) repeat protein
MGEVYRAHDTRLRRDVAVKVLREEIATGGWERFEREARAASALSHPHICSVFDIGESGGRPFLVMELLEGKTLREHIGKQPMKAAAAIALGEQVAEALEAAHAKGIIHRDIKTGNIMVIGQGHVKVLDFGLAKYAVTEADDTRTVELATEAGTVLGTPHYLAPELLHGKAADARSDIWALGVVLYEMAAGQLPFQGPTKFAITSAILHEPAPRLPASVPAGFRAIVERCLAKRPEDRFPSAAELRAALDGLKTSARRGTPRRRLWFWVAGAVVVNAGIFLWLHTHATSAPRLTSTGAPASTKQEANDAFELAMNLQRVQNDIPRSQQALERAIAVDPHFAEALRYHAFNYAIELLNGFSNDPGLLYQAEQELRQAESEDRRLRSIQTARAAVYVLQGRKELVPVRELDQILRDDPSNHDAVLWRAILYWLSGANAECKKLLTGVLEREPLMAASRMFLGETLRTEGDLPDAIREQQKVLEQAPGNISAVHFLAAAYMDAGQFPKARALLEEKRDAFGKNYLWRLTWALFLARDGKRDEALQALDEETLKFAGAAFVVTLDAAEFYAVSGDTGKAIEWLDKAVRNGDQRIEWFRKDPSLAGIRQDPRFGQIIDSVRFAREHSPAPRQ